MSTYYIKLTSKSAKKLCRDIPTFDNVINISKVARSPYYFKLFNINCATSSGSSKEDVLYVDMTNGLLDDITDAF